MMPSSTPGLGRIAPPNEDKDSRFPMRKLIDPRRVAGVTSRHWYSPGILDQDGTSDCVGFGWKKWLKAGPIVNKHPIAPATIVREAKKIDEWDGEDYDGTSVRAGAKVLQKLGLISGYFWARTVDPVVDYLLAHGPVVVGTDWNIEMFTPDRWGFIDIGGQNAGGHCYFLGGINKELRRPRTTEVGHIRSDNSWDDTWGDNGSFWISIEKLDKLIRARGEACVATEVKL